MIGIYMQTSVSKWHHLPYGVSQCTQIPKYNQITNYFCFGDFVSAELPDIHASQSFSKNSTTFLETFDLSQTHIIVITFQYYLCLNT